MTQQLAHSAEQRQPARQQEQRGITWKQVQELTGYDLAQIALIRATVAKDAPMEELAVFLHSANKLGLDPLARQVYWIRRQGKGTLQVGIDGFRLVAARSNLYAGSEEPVFRGTLVVNDGDRKITVPERASITVWKMVQGHKCAFVGEARWTEFYPGSGENGFMYRKMPFHMLAKDAEAQALRKAFPAEMTMLPQRAGDAEIEAGPTLVVEQRPEPERAALNAAAYDRMIGANYDDEPSRTAATSPPPAAVQSGAPANPTSSAGAPPDDNPAVHTSGTARAPWSKTDVLRPVREVGGDSASESSVSLAPSRNLKLLEDAAAIGVKGLRALKFTEADSLEVVEARTWNWRLASGVGMVSWTSRHRIQGKRGSSDHAEPSRHVDSDAHPSRIPPMA